MESDWRWNRYAWPWHFPYMGMAAQLQAQPTKYVTEITGDVLDEFQLWETVDGSQTWRLNSWVYYPHPSPFPTTFFGPVLPDHA